jgi:hypothetical protein
MVTARRATRRWQRDEVKDDGDGTMSNDNVAMA